MKAATAARTQSRQGIAIHSRLHARHPYRAAMDEVFPIALRGLPGPWDVSVYPVGRAWFRIDVVAPSAASWSLSVPLHEGPRGDDLANTIRAACLRHCVLQPENGVASKPFPAAPEGTSR
jgi:hypothetical protein